MALSERGGGISIYETKWNICGIAQHFAVRDRRLVCHTIPALPGGTEYNYQTLVIIVCSKLKLSGRLINF